MKGWINHGTNLWLWMLDPWTVWESWALTSKNHRSSHPEVFFRKGVLRISSIFTWEHPFRRVISIKLQSNFIEIALQHGCSPANLLHILRTVFPRYTSGRLLLKPKKIWIKVIDVNFKKEYPKINWLRISKPISIDLN